MISRKERNAQISELRFVITICIIAVAISMLLLFAKKEYKQADLDTVKGMIMDDREPSGHELKQYDLSKDGKISSLDYVLIKKEVIE